MIGSNEKPRHEHAEDFINDDPRGVVHVMLLLGELGDHNCAQREDEQKGNEEKERGLEVA